MITTKKHTRKVFFLRDSGKSCCICEANQSTEEGGGETKGAGEVSEKKRDERRSSGVKNVELRFGKKVTWFHFLFRTYPSRFNFALFSLVVDKSTISESCNVHASFNPFCCRRNRRGFSFPRAFTLRRKKLERGRSSGKKGRIIKCFPSGGRNGERNDPIRRASNSQSPPNPSEKI